MNFSLLGWQPIVSSAKVHDDDNCNDWLGGEAWVTPRPFDHEGAGVASIDRGADPAIDWIPL